MKGMTIRAMAEACHGVYHGSQTLLDREITGVTTDSRTIDKDCLFVAIPGERVDGHAFVQQALDAGALCCLTQKEMPLVTGAYIEVKSSVTAMADLAAYYRSILPVRVVGITGSVGKTSTKETVASVLSRKFQVCKTEANFNNEIGLPLTVFRLKETDQVAVLEMGISDFGEMRALTRIAKPDISIITNIGVCHLENLKTRDGILRAKSEIFEGMNEQGIAILNGDDDKLVTIDAVCGKKPIFFGITNKAGIYADQIREEGLAGTSCSLHGLQTADGVHHLDIHIPIPGRHMVYNVLAAVAVAQQMGLTATEIKEGIATMETISGRNHIIQENGFLIIDDCYNANPVSMKASVDVLCTAQGRKVCILGDMFELGNQERTMHFDVGEYIGAREVDVLITAGRLAANIADGVRDYKENHYQAQDCEIQEFQTRDEAIEALPKLLQKGDNILVKASHAMEFGKVIEAIRTL